MMMQGDQQKMQMQAQLEQLKMQNAMQIEKAKQEYQAQENQLKFQLEEQRNAMDREMELKVAQMKMMTERNTQVLWLWLVTSFLVLFKRRLFMWSKHCIFRFVVSAHVFHSASLLPKKRP